MARVQNSRFKIDMIEWVSGEAIQIVNNGKLYVNIQNQLSEIVNPGDTLTLKMQIPHGNNIGNKGSRDTGIKVIETGK